MKQQGPFVSNLSGNLSYNSFKPSKLPPFPNLLVSNELLDYFSLAHQLLGELDGKSTMIPYIDIFISMYVRKEALLSSQIEGTQATLDDILDPNIDDNINLDKRDVVNYVRAVNFASDLIDKLPVSNRFIKEIHKVLISNSRGNEKNPGEFRNSQNWIGNKNSSISSATYIPPNVDDMKSALNDLEDYIHNDNSLPNLIKIALIHYQFETIHPFLDGNGRIGRLLIVLLLKEYNILNHNTLYVSLYLKKNRREYYDRLMDVRTKGHYESWIIFFLKAIIESAKHSIGSIEKIIKLNNNDLNLIKNTKGNNEMFVLFYNYLLENPIFSITHASNTLSKSYNTISKIVDLFIDLNIVHQRNKQ